MNCLATGRYPTHNHCGEPFLNGDGRSNLAGELISDEWRFLFSESRADLPWNIMTYKWPGFAHSLRCCHLCHASKTCEDLLFTDLRPTARHRETLCSHTDYIDSTTPEGRSPLCGMHGWHLWRCWVDAQHCLDLGILQHANGSCLWVLVTRRGLWQGSQANRFRAAHMHYVEWCKLNHIHDVAECFKKEFVRPHAASYAKLKSLKAAEQRWLVYWLHAILFP